ncbi:MAG: ABC transporter ATP-binding protein [Thaumarchaeota archaeon]|nr:ABC transporter ATP-binding protein [Nitrososphaerota archaeon]MCL5316902.1 ABC transporter ATP-binding protein [Nitrososphaerota archaeon]
MIELNGVTKKYGKFNAVDDVSFKVDKNELIALLGPNGAGKTTVLKCIIGLVTFNGSIKVDGLDVKKSGVDVRRRVAYHPQQVSLYNHMSVADNLKFFAGVKRLDNDTISRSLEENGLKEHASKKVSELSEGLKQRLMLATTLLGDSPIILFDEPSANLDIRGVLAFKEVVDSLSRKGKTIILSTHLLSDINEIANRIIVMNQGKLVTEGSINEIMREVELNTRILITLVEKIDEQAVNDVEEMLRKAGAKTVSIEADRIIVSVEAPDKIPVLRALDESGLVIKDFRVYDPSLEDAFLRITGDEPKRSEVKNEV